MTQCLDRYAVATGLLTVSRGVPLSLGSAYTSCVADLKNHKLIWLKGWLFLFAGLLASAGLLLEAFSWRVALLLVIAVWCFCRFYYFAFYVIEHYVDPTYKFAGLYDFFKYALRRKPPSDGGV